MDIPQYENKNDLFAYLVKNKSLLIAQKTAGMKTADGVFLAPLRTQDKDDENKALSTGQMEELMNSDAIRAKLVINTTNIMDSHMDVHLPGLWKKSLQETKALYLLKEHKLSFEGIITDEVKAGTQKMKWNELGLPYMGETEALVFDVVIEKARNPYMFEQYARGRVKNHSVGMRYVKYKLAINSTLYPEEKEVYDKHIEEIANKADVEANGWFWAVYEAKAIEGSAVPIGSNTATPTHSVEVKDIVEPEQPTQQNTGAGDTTPNKKKGLSIYQFN